MTTPSTNKGQIALRVPKDAEHEYGIVTADTIPIDKPCLVIIGGERTLSIKDANYYASMFQRLFTAYGVDDIAIYSAYYSFNNSNRQTERNCIFCAAQTRVKFKISAENEYIRDLYNHIIRPRIINDQGQRFSDIQAIQNMHRIMIFTHCHGAAVVRMFQDLMIEDMEKYGYDKRIIPQIMKRLLVVQHAPTAPIHNSRFNMISFMSASDTMMKFHNQFSRYVSDHAEDMMPSYFRMGNFFATYAFTYQMINEHQIVGLVPETDEDQLTPDGKIIVTAERNTIIHGANSLKSPDTSILEPQTLIAPISSTDPVKPNFDELKDNGDAFLAVMEYDLKQARKQTTR